MYTYMYMYLSFLLIVTGIPVGDGWFLEKVTVKENKGASQEFVFPCHCWLDATLDEDSKTSRELYVNNKPINCKYNHGRNYIDLQLYITYHQHA